MNILYADNDMVIQNEIVRTLVNQGYEITTVDDGKEAIETIQTDYFDLIILDLFLSKKSGFEVVEFLREELHDNTPVLILSRNNIEGAIEEAYTAGADDYIAKPFKPDDLLIKINYMLAHKR